MALVALVCLVTVEVVADSQAILLVQETVPQDKKPHQAM